MKRSMVNSILADARDFIESHGYRLPPFASLAPAEMRGRKDELAAIIDARLGWDITDYGQGRFEELGLFLFTVRNGSVAELRNGGGMCYAEKIMISRRDQISPMHRHILKTEDIINRGGAKLAIRMFETDGQGHLDKKAKVPVASDGIMNVFEPGETVLLEPGQSVTLRPGNWHEFWGEGGDVLIGEVSTVNDDETDNIFAADIGRFSRIEEDCAPDHLLVSDYGEYLK